MNKNNYPEYISVAGNKIDKDCFVLGDNYFDTQLGFDMERVEKQKVKTLNRG